MRPRIRSLKPEALQHRRVGPLTDAAFRVWVTLITQCDDEGRVICEPAQVRAWAFAYHPAVAVEDVEKTILEVADTGLIRLYHGPDGTRYAYFPSWNEHQKISHRTPSKLPAPPPFDGDSLNNSEDLRRAPEDSRDLPSDRDLDRDLDRDRIGKEHRGREGSRGEKPEDPPNPPHGGGNASRLKRIGEFLSIPGNRSDLLKLAQRAGYSAEEIEAAHRGGNGHEDA